MPIINFDNAATIALDPDVLEAILPYLTMTQGNPFPTHSLGRLARLAVEAIAANGRAPAGLAAE